MIEADAFEVKLAELRHSFGTRALGDASELERLAVLMASEQSDQALSRIRHLAHRLAGGASTFGLPALTAPAVALEQETLDRGANIVALTAALIAKIRQHVEQGHTNRASNAD